MKKFLTLIAVAAMAFAAQAAECTAADGTASCEYVPVYGYNFENPQHNQIQYPAAELAMPAGAEITVMKFYTSTPDEVNAMGGIVKVSLANIDEATPWGLDAWGGISGNLLDVTLTTVAAIVTPAADEEGIWTITFDDPFTYTGNALLVDIETVEEGEWKYTYFNGKEMGDFYAMSTFGYAGSKKGDTVLPKATFTYEGGSEEPGLELLSEANALEDGSEFKFDGDAVVTVFKNGYLFLRDESGYGMIPNVQGSFENGQVLAQGWTATKTSVNDWVRYTDATGLSASGETNAELAAAQVLEGAVNESMLNAYVVIENTPISSSGGGGGLLPSLPVRSLKLPDGSSIEISSVLWGMDGDANDVHYNVYGIIVKERGVLKINPVEFELYVEPEPEGLRGDVNDDKDVTVADVTALIDYLLSGNTEGINLDNADCDLVDGVSVSDVTALIDYLLSGEW